MHALEHFNFSEYILQYLLTRFNKSRTQDINSSNDAIKNFYSSAENRQLGLSKLADTQFWQYET